MNLKIKISLCALNRQPLGFQGALYSSMSAAISRYTSMDPQGWVSTIRTPFLYIADSTNRVKFSSVCLGKHWSHYFFFILTYFLCNFDFDQKVLTSGQFGHLEWIDLDIPAL